MVSRCAQGRPVAWPSVGKLTGEAGSREKPCKAVCLQIPPRDHAIAACCFGAAAVWPWGCVWHRGLLRSGRRFPSKLQPFASCPLSTPRCQGWGTSWAWPAALSGPPLPCHHLGSCHEHGTGFPGGLVGQDSTCSAGDTGDAGLIPGLGRSPGEGHGNPLQYSCLDNAMDRGAWRATVHGVARSRTQQKPSEHTHIDTWAWDASLDAHKLKQYPLPAAKTAPPPPTPRLWAGDSKGKDFLMFSLWCSGLSDVCVN